MRHKIAIAILAAGLECLFAGASRASVFLSFTAGQAQYNAAPGSIVPVQIYLQETLTGGDTSIVTSQSGLFSAGLKLVPQTPLPSHPASIASSADILPNSEFSGGSIKNLNPLTMLLADGILAEPGPMGNLMPDGSRRVPLATFNFTAGSAIGQTTTFKITDYDDYGISSDTLTWAGTVLDNRISSGLFSVTVIPEPSGLIFLSVLGILARRAHPHRSTT